MLGAPCSINVVEREARKALEFYDLPNLDQAQLIPLVTSRNEVMKVVLGSQRYILRFSGLVDATHRLQRHTHVLECLKQAGVAAEEVLHNRIAQTVTQGANGSYGLFTHIDGPVSALNIEAYSQLGFELANLHLKTRHLDCAIDGLVIFKPLDWLNSAKAEVEAQTLSPMARNRLQVCLLFIAEKLNEIDWPSMPGQLGHGDAHPMNLIAGHWIDLEDAYYGPVAYDLATVVWSTLRCQQTRPLWQAALQAYNSVSAIDPETLGQISILVALRHLWWLGLHARYFGSFPIHQQEPAFLDQGIELLVIICTDACGMPAPSL